MNNLLFNYSAAPSLRSPDGRRTHDSRVTTHDSRGQHDFDYGKIFQNILYRVGYIAYTSDRPRLQLSVHQLLNLTKTCEFCSPSSNRGTVAIVNSEARIRFDLGYESRCITLYRLNMNGTK